MTLSPAKRRAATLVAVGLGCAVWSVVLNTVLNVSTFAGDPRSGHLLLALRANTFLVSSFLIWVLLLGLVALTSRLWLSLGVATLLVAALAAINAAKIQYRGDPLQPSDTAFMSEFGFLTEVIGMRWVVLAVVVVVVVIAVSVLAGRLVARRIPHLTAGLGRRDRWLFRGGRVLVVLGACAALVMAGNFHAAHNPLRYAFDANGAHWKPWQQRSNYRANGFVAGTLFNTGLAAMPRPKGYNRAAMQDIASEYSQLAERINRGRTGTLDDVNVVLILSESFSQPQWLKTVKWAEDPIPNTTALMARTLAGKMLAPGFGGGTANVEFELLTGQSMSMFSSQIQVAFDQVVPKHPDYPSFVSGLVDSGHRAVALHPFRMSMYRRKEVLPDLGFESLVPRSEMSHKDRVERSRFISDKSAYTELAETIRDTKAPVLAHLITMQNHLPYSNSYADPIRPTSGLDEKAAEKAGQYVRGIHNTDAALPGFLNDLRKSREKTVVLFYGDHLPGEIYPMPVQRREGARRMHETPWFIWTNWTHLAPRMLPTVSANQFMPLVFEAADAPITPFQALLTKLRSVTPAMDARLLIGADNEVVTRKQLTDEQRQVLRDYRLVQFDLSVGKRYSEDQLMKVAAAQTPSAPVTSSAVKP